MDRGTYSVTSMGLAKIRQLEITNNNLANVNTPGFKRTVLVGETQSFENTLAKLVSKSDPYAAGDHQRTPGVVSLESKVDFSAGPVRQTGNPFDVALADPKDFFVIQTAQGERYTRAGNFTLNEEGSIVTQDGQIVMGEGGAISIQQPNGKITEDGSVVVAGQPVGKLRVVRFEDTSGLKSEGGNRFTLANGAAAPAQADARVLVESLEMSNVSAITSMIDLISTNRGFEAYTRTAQTIDQMNQTAISQIGKPR